MDFHLLDIPKGYDSDGLGWLKEEYPPSSPHQKSLHVIMQYIKHPYRTCIVYMPRLRDVGIRSTELMNKQEYPDAIYGHG